MLRRIIGKVYDMQEHMGNAIGETETQSKENARNKKRELKECL